VRPLVAAAALVLLSLAGAAGQAGRQSPFETESAPAVKTRIDEIVLGALKHQGIAPARLSSDAVFVRRAYLDAIGTLPTADEARAFIDDRDPGKRAALIDRLLARDEFADYWAMKWCDALRVKSEFPSTCGRTPCRRTTADPNRRPRQHPYDRFARELLTASGSNFRDAPVNFYRALQSREPRAIASAVALTFMASAPTPGRRRAWTAWRVFSQIGLQADRRVEGRDRLLRSRQGAAAGKPGARAHGRPARRHERAPRAGRRPRQAFASWLTAPSNPYFARAAVNRACTG